MKEQVGGGGVAADEMAVVARLVSEACLDMLAASGCAAEEVDGVRAAAGDRDIAGFIGFTGPARGSLTVAASSRLFRLTHPSGGATAVSEIDLFDWTREMANQILGRVKRRFCERGRDFEASTPTAIAGRELGRRFPQRASAVNLAFAVGEEVVAVCFEIVPSSDLRIFPEHAEPIRCEAEGEMVLF